MKMENEKINMNPQNLIHVLIGLACIGLLPTTQAVLPAPDGGYPGGNTAEGQAALLSLTTGGFNTAVGFLSLRALVDGSFNTAIGAGALPLNTADRNTATGAGTLFHNTVGTDNTANGTFALFNNIGGYSNTATGVEALGSNFVGYENTANGVNALVGNTYGARNTATGVEALFSNLDGSYNTAIGNAALQSNNGSYNTAIGGGALYNNTGEGNIGVGFNAGVNLTTGGLNIDIGNYTGLAGESRTIRIGTQDVQFATYIGGIFGATLTDGVPVLVGTDGHLGTAISSVRFKEDIKPMDGASEAILSLRPVTFHYKSDAKSVPQFGLIAEEVAQVNPDLIVRDKDGKPYSVRYDQVNAMLLNEFLKEHRKVEEQQATITQLKSTVAQQQNDFQATAAQQQKQIEALTAGLQKVSAQLEAGKPAPQVVATNP
jgi:hypothetical protein